MELAVHVAHELVEMEPPHLAGIAAAREQVHQCRLAGADRAVQVGTAHAIHVATCHRCPRHARVDLLQHLDHVLLRAVGQPVAATHETAQKRQRAAMLASTTAQLPPRKLHRSGPAYT